jgi:hypothetical protein
MAYHVHEPTGSKNLHSTIGSSSASFEYKAGIRSFNPGHSVTQPVHRFKRELRHRGHDPSPRLIVNSGNGYPFVEAPKLGRSALAADNGICSIAPMT